MIEPLGDEVLDRAAAGAPEADEDRRFLIYGVPWERYVALRKLFDDRAGLRMHYLEGVLEIMSPSSRHELIKKLFARLLEAYANEMELDLRGHGSTTFKKEAKARGAEPDECYCLGWTIEDGSAAAPDIAFEVVLGRGGIDKLAVYRGLGTPEVWLWKKDILTLHRLNRRGYSVVERSEFLPELDLQSLAAYVREHWKNQDVRPYIKQLRGTRRS